MLQIEIAEKIKDGKLYDLSEKINYNLALDQEEKEISQLADAWVKEVATKGDPNKEIAAYLQKVIQQEIYDAPSELIEAMFETGTVGEFDYVDYTIPAENTLQVHNAAKGGTVDRSFIDFKMLLPQTVNQQVETDLSYVDMRKNGFKSVATLTTFMTEALQNKQYVEMFNRVDAAITGGSQVFTETGTTPTLATMDKVSLYLGDRTSAGMLVTLSKYAHAIKRMEGYAQYLSDNMKDNFNRFYLPQFFDGFRIASLSGAKRYSQDIPVLPDKRMFGIAGEIGKLDMKGNVNVYEVMDDYNERLHLLVKDFTYSYIIYKPENMCKVILA